MDKNKQFERMPFPEIDIFPKLTKVCNFIKQAFEHIRLSDSPPKQFVPFEEEPDYKTERI